MLTGPGVLKLPSVPCCPKMAEAVLYWAATAGSNYWLGCRKGGQIHCIIRDSVDSGSPSQWLVINKIIGERWQRFLEFFLICMSFCTELFMTSFFIREGWGTNDIVSYRVTCLYSGFKLSVCLWREKRNSMCGVHLYSPKILCLFWVIFCACAIYTFADPFFIPSIIVEQAFLTLTLSCKTVVEGCLYIRILPVAPENVFPYVFISVALTITSVMSAHEASFWMALSTSYTQTRRCLSLLFQLYFTRLRCHCGTCFLDNANVISPFFQEPLI